METTLARLPDGLSSAYAHLGARRVIAVTSDEVIVDDHSIGRFPGARDLRFSPDGSRHAFVSQTASGRQGVYVDGLQIAEHDGVSLSTPVFSSDGRELAYGAYDGGAWWVYRGTTRFGPFDAEQPGAGWNTCPLVFTPEGALVYAATRGDAWSLERDGETISAGWRLVRDPIYAAGRLLAKARRDGAWYAIDGIESYGPFATLNDPVASEDGSLAGFSAESKDGGLIIVNGKVVARPSRVGMVVALARGGVAYQAEDDAGREYVVLSGQRMPICCSVRGLVLSASGDAVGYVGVDDHHREYACVNEERFGPHANVDHLSLRLSPGGRLAYLLAEERSRIAVDGSSGPGYDALWSNAHFIDEQTVEYIAQRGREFVHVVAEHPR